MHDLKELRDAGKVTAALERFQKAYDLAATPITTVELARTHQLLGHLVEARRLCASVDGLEKKPGESAKSLAARDEAKQLAADLDSLIAGYRFDPKELRQFVRQLFRKEYAKELEETQISLEAEPGLNLLVIGKRRRRRQEGRRRRHRILILGAVEMHVAIAGAGRRLELRSLRHGNALPELGAARSARAILR